MRGLRAGLWWWGPPLAYAAAIFFLSSQSSFPVPAGVWTFDKLLHGLEYGGLGVLVARALYGSKVSAGRAAALSLLICAAYGVSDEFHQSFVPGRDSSAFDALADAAGAGAAALAWYLFFTQRKVRS